MCVLAHACARVLAHVCVRVRAHACARVRARACVICLQYTIIIFDPG